MILQQAVEGNEPHSFQQLKQLVNKYGTVRYTSKQKYTFELSPSRSRYTL